MLSKSVDQVTDELMVALRDNHGGTVRASLGAPTPTTGYAVGVQGIEVPRLYGHHNSSTRARVRAFVRQNITRVNATPATFFGIWEDVNYSGRIFLDVTRVIWERAAAVELGNDQSQISIWDIANDTEIRL